MIPPTVRPWWLALGLAACNNGPHFAAPGMYDLDAWARESDAGAVADGPEADGDADADADADGGTEGEGRDAASPADGALPDRPAPVPLSFAACTSPPCINVLNNCPIPLWTHAVATVPIDDGNVRRLEPGQQYQYAALPRFGGGRIYAYYREPASKQDPVRLVSDYNQFVEMTVDTDAAGAWAQNYNISYVDYAGLPVLMKAQGACRETSCPVRLEDWMTMLQHCPTELRNQDQGLSTCMGSYIYCLGANDETQPYCRKMRDAHGVAGSAVYGGVFPEHPSSDLAFWDGVAAWNRGTTPGDADDAHYYRTEPFNHYARWIHRELGCSDVYAFSTDDHQDKAGFVRCTSPVLNVVWCPLDGGRPVIF